MIYRHKITGNYFRMISLRSSIGRFVQIDDNGNDIYEMRDFLTFKEKVPATSIIRMQNLEPAKRIIENGNA